MRSWLGLVGAVLLAGCGPVDTHEVRVTIFDFHYSPTHVRVKPGQTVRVLNLDTAPHSATSAPSPGRLVPGESDGIAFDTGLFRGAERTFTIPEDAAPGSVVPFFCTAHQDFQHGVGRLIVE
jgi:plastocyanin